MENTYVYIVFSSTPYRIGKFVRRLTAEPYNHVSIALDAELTQMYSFARRYYHTPFLGGFVKESLSRYCPKDTPARIRICRLPVSAEQHQQLSELLTEMYLHNEQYLYNHLSAGMAVFRQRIKLRDAYTCAEFCVQILNKLGINTVPDKFHTVGQLERLLRPYAVYTGTAPEFQEFDKEYYAPKPVLHATTATVRDYITLFTRF